jgi:hypothetical protein
MAKDLRDTMLNAAASTYGSKHYRGILFMHGLRRFWPAVAALAMVATVGAIGWALAPAAHAAGDHPKPVAAVIVVALVLITLAAIVLRRIRSPYRRRRF